MTALNIDNLQKKVLIVGPFHNKTDKLLRVESMIQNYDLVVFNGGMCDDGKSLNLIQEHIEIINRMSITNKVIYNLDSSDLFYCSIARKTITEIEKWLCSCPNVVIISFTNKTKLIITAGGITPTMTLEKITNDIETTFVKFINKNSSWHKNYNGRFGYVISNEPCTLEPPQFYNFSAQIGNLPNKLETRVYAQEADKFGLKETILL